MYWGENTAFCCNWGQARELSGQLPPSLYVKRGPDSPRSECEGLSSWSFQPLPRKSQVKLPLFTVPDTASLS